MHRKRAGPTFSLFPFLSVLICLLGVLIFIVLATTAISLGAGKNVKIRIASTRGNLDLTPAYIEWDGNSVTLHPEQIVISAADALQNNGVNASGFGALLDEIENNRNTQYVIVAVRPSGFHNFSRLRKAIVSRNIEIGYEPINQDWDLTVGSGDSNQ